MNDQSPYTLAKTRQWFEFYIDFLAINGGPIIVGAGPLTITAPPLPEEWFIGSVALYITVGTGLTAAANKIQSSADSINWFDLITAAGTVGVARNTTGGSVPISGMSHCRYFRFTRSDSVGAISQLMIGCGINP